MNETFDRFTIIKQLAWGMTNVYIVFDPKPPRNAVLKVLPVNIFDNPLYRQRFDRESTIIANLNHTFIVPLYESGVFNGQPYQLMRYMEGGSLDDLLRHGPLSFDNITAILQTVTAAIDYAHTQNVVHRDIKPRNILFDRDMLAFLADFGVARLVNRHDSLLAAPVGTPGYMSPEQAQGNQSLDQRSDIFSLGILLFEMLTGKHPFHAESHPFVQQRLNDDVTPQLISFNPNLPANCQKIIDKALAKDPADRFVTAVHLKRAFTLAINPDKDEEFAYLLSQDHLQQEPIVLYLASEQKGLSLRHLRSQETGIPAKIGYYDIMAELGHGGMGRVYKVSHEGSLYALKILDTLKMARPTDAHVRRFEQEIEILQGLNHPHIVPIQDHGSYESDGYKTPFLVMPYIEGGTLQDRLKAHYEQGNGTFSLAEVRQILEPLAEALDYLHDQQVTHFDIKPSNILFDPQGNLLLTDFGLALTPEITLLGIPDANKNLVPFVGGTVGYMSPEQIAYNPRPDHRADIYAVGVILYRLLAGTQPYLGDSHDEILEKHKNAPIPSLLASRPDLPSGIQPIIEQALAKNPEKRYQSAGELVHDLRQLVEESSLTAPTVLLVNGSVPAEAVSPTEPYSPVLHRSTPDEPTIPYDQMKQLVPSPGRFTKSVYKFSSSVVRRKPKGKVNPKPIRPVGITSLPLIARPERAGYWLPFGILPLAIALFIGGLVLLIGTVSSIVRLQEQPLVEQQPTPTDILVTLTVGSGATLPSINGSGSGELMPPAVAVTEMPFRFVEELPAPNASPVLIPTYTSTPTAIPTATPTLTLSPTSIPTSTIAYSPTITPSSPVQFTVTVMIATPVGTVTPEGTKTDEEQ